MKKKLRNFIQNRLPLWFVRTPLLSSLYYFIFSKKFRREHHAVLSGKVSHLKGSYSVNANLYTLIRNTHRIEKGLLMKPRRDVFASDFIAETVSCYEKVYSNDFCVKSSQEKWFTDVLTEYFSVTGSHPVLDTQRERFFQIVSDIQDSENGTIKSIPYKRITENKPQISYEDFYSLTRYRRSVRWFLNKKVPHELIDKAILAANQSPTACNRQPYEFRVIDEPELLTKVSSIPMGVRGYEHNIPMMVVVVGNLDAYFDERDRHVMYIDASLANMSLILALETLGLSSCAINWPDIEIKERQMQKLLKLQPYQRPIMCLAVGYADPEGFVAYSEKRALDLIRKYN